MREKNIIANRLVRSYLLSIVSIALVLMIVGIFGILAVNASKVSSYFKENVKISVILKEDVTEKQALDIERKIKRDVAVKSTTYISKEQGTKEMEEMLGDDFLNVFESNPIPISIEVALKASHFTPDSVETFKARVVKSYPHIHEISYQASLIEILNSNIKKVGIVLASITTLLLLVSIVLINNTVRLNVYSKRFSIYTMKLVGATKKFIRAPFLIKAIFQGLISGLTASAILISMLYVIQDRIGISFQMLDPQMLLVVIGGIITLGVFICTICTYFVVGRLVSLTNDELYY